MGPQQGAPLIAQMAQRQLMQEQIFGPGGMTGGGMTGGAPAAGGAAGGAIPGLQPVGSGGSGGGIGGTGAATPSPLMDPATMTRMGQYMILNGEARAGAQLLQLAEQRAGGPGYTMGANGQGFYTPGGAADPRVAGTLAGAKVTGEKAAGAPYDEPIKVPVQNPDGTVTEFNVPRPAWAAQNGGGQPGMLGGQLGPNPGDAYYRATVAGESGGNDNATNTGPNTHAVGAAQFQPGTWLPLAKQLIPGAANMSDQQLLDLRTNSNASQAMTLAYAAQNAPVLQGAGFDPSPVNLGLAHLYGPGGAVSILRAPPGTPLANVLDPKAMQENSPFAHMTTTDAIIQKQRRYAGTTRPVRAAASGRLIQCRHVRRFTASRHRDPTYRRSLSGVPAGAFRGATLPPKLGPEQTKVAEGYGERQNEIQVAAAKAPQAQATLATMGNLLDQYKQTGAGTPARQALMKSLLGTLQTLGFDREAIS